MMGTPLKPRLLPKLAPAPPRPPPQIEPRVTFLSLPPELRIEIYKLALANVRVHIMPTQKDRGHNWPHALTRTSRQIRSEVLPLMHALCPIEASITDFNFDGLREWLARIPPDQETNLCKNRNLIIRFNTSTPTAQPPKSIDSLRRWLHQRADKHRPQPNWQYVGNYADNKVGKDLARRAKRMKDEPRQKEFWIMLKALGVEAGNSVGRPRGRAE